MLFSYLGFLALTAGFGLLILLTFGVLTWLHIPAGNLVDWLIGIASFWWLMVIVTVPWNIYFDAKEVISEATISKEKKIFVDDKQVDYVSKIARWSIIIAIALHIVSALGLYTLAWTGVSAVGYVSSGATLLLTGLRPIVRGYQYLAMRLSAIRQEIKYPREDINKLLQRFSKLEATVKQLEEKLDLKKPNSWAAIQEQKLRQARQEINQLNVVVEKFQTRNQLEHEQLSREAKSAISQLTEDSQFLDHVREIIRFFKTS